jgi:ATP-dependent Clp protease ATP-binding subunit ClpA
MAEFPVPLDNLITYVKTLHAQGGPLDNLSDAMVVSARLDEQSDALIGYFVDQARRSGASWSQIGASMGVTKQAAQKRFVRDMVPEGQQVFSRFTQRARNTLGAAGQLAGADPIGAAHLTAALLAEPDGVAAKIIVTAGLTGGQVCAAVGAGPAAPVGEVDAAALRELTFSDEGKAVLKGTLKAALRLGHNYLGTEHLLLGILFADSPAAQALVSLGLDPGTAERLLTAEIEEVQARRKAN